MDQDVDGWKTLFTRANQLLRATTHPAAVRLPVEGSLPSLDSATGWLNSPPLTAAGLGGKVVLVDFWTYTCINWLRTLPYLRAWANKYKDHGLVVLGVHTPEFDVEHDLDNVRRAVKELGVRQGCPCGSRCASTGSRQAPPTGLMSTARATARSPNHASTSSSASLARFPSAPLRSPSSTLASRPMPSPSARP
jgi:thiol-disulfide isomerase/thioredoxin